MNSGYVLLDLTGLDLAGASSQTIDGITGRTARAISTGKQVIAAGIVNGTDTISPVSVAASVTTNGTTLTAAGIALTVGAEDAVTVGGDGAKSTTRKSAAK